MQFVANGPEIPAALLNEHEEGNVVFFCGAGISYSAGLMNFEELVEAIYRETKVPKNAIERQACESKQYDATLGLLEQRLAGRGLAMRRALETVLKPALRRKGSTDGHAALLQLARTRKGALRLVTTNFDRVFHAAARRTKQSFHPYVAPMLPIPKNSHWDGLVFLHGLLPQQTDENALNRLVVTSGDFGLAYLTERWAARFVSELFCNYTVCFIGYSIDDPVMRYMMHALAADRMRGEARPRAYAFVSFRPGKEVEKTKEWEAKGVTPVLYEEGHGSTRHSALYKTLTAWAETYRNGAAGKEQYIVQHALAQPSKSTPQENFVDRVLWALSDDTGLPAKRFAEFNPVPSLDWLLEVFSTEHFGHIDLIRFRVPPKKKLDEKLRFSLVRRPAPYDHAPPMQLVVDGSSDSRWDDVMNHLARWLVRHLDDPRLLLWIVQRGGKPHTRLHWFIEGELVRLVSLERQGSTSELDDIRLHAPNAIPGPMMRKLWGLLLSGRVKSPMRHYDLYGWRTRLRQEGLTTPLRLRFCELLAPQVALRKPFRWGEENKVVGQASPMRQLVDFEIVLAADHVRSTLLDNDKDEQWTATLPRLLDDLQHLLRDALDLLNELGEATQHDDPSYFHLPSISSHWQNRGFSEWTTLIELLRDAWLEVYRVDRLRAGWIARNWFEWSYPTFKRLSLFAASQDNCIAPSEWIEWLISDGGRWFWSINTRREVLRLLVLQGSRLDNAIKTRLEIMILTGPPVELYKSGLDPEWWQEHVKCSIWLYLAKLQTSGVKLGDRARICFAELSDAHPSWQLAPYDRDEFSHWMSGTGDPDYDENKEVEVTPEDRSELAKWLAKPITDRRFYQEDTWPEVCRRKFKNSLNALCELSRNDIWPASRWAQALQVWSEKRIVARTWRFVMPLLQEMPDRTILEIDHSVTWWITMASKEIRQYDSALLHLCRRILGILRESRAGTMLDGVSTDKPVFEAINHPVGKITEALINLWFIGKPNDNDKLPAEIDVIFTELCDVRIEQFHHGRVLLGSRLIQLFRVDRTWAEQNLLPLFHWSNSTEAKAVWQGFFWSPRLYPPLLLALKAQFLACANHYSEMGEFRSQFSTFLTYAALEPMDGFTREEFQSAFSQLPATALEEAAQALSQVLEGTGAQREEYWRSRLHPFWRNVWPQSGDRATPRIAEALIRVAIAAGSEFPTAFAAFKDWLLPIEYLHFVMGLLHKSGLCGRFPREALSLLDRVIDDQPWASPEMGQCLDEIVQAVPEFRQDRRYMRLHEYSRRRSQS